MNGKVQSKSIISYDTTGHFMVSFDYLPKGLNALSRAHLVNSMAGHLGAAVIAGYFIAEQHPNLDAKVYTGIEGELERIIRGESVFSPRKNSPVTVKELFQAYPKEPAKPTLIRNIADSLEKNISETRQSGHNVIFASIAIRALKDHEDLATTSVINGICKLMEQFNAANAGSGYYGKERGRIYANKIVIPKEKQRKPYTTLAQMAEAVLDELIQFQGERRDGFGGLWHVINHGAALAELSSYGFGDLARKGIPAHFHHMELYRTLPDVSDEFGKETKSKYDPHSAEYWKQDDLRRDRAHLDHRIKTIYGFDALAELVADEEKRKKAILKMRYLM
ncbi:MAG: hypothetical protein R3B84_03525 [Zavarzinella sp.]